MRSLGVFIWMAVVLAGCNLRTTPLNNPEPVRHNLEDRSAPVLVQVLSQKGWRVTGKKPGAIYAVHVRGKRRLEAAVSYNEYAARITFIAARGYGRQSNKGGTIKVHPKVNSMLNQLSQDLRGAFYRAEFVSGPLPPPGPLPAPTAPPLRPLPAPAAPPSTAPPSATLSPSQPTPPQPAAAPPPPPPDDSAAADAPDSKPKKTKRKKKKKKKTIGGPLGDG